MKVALIGNMNNNFYTLARYLNNEKINVTLFLLSDEQSHFKPENDTFKANDIDIKQLKWGALKNFYSTSVQAIKNDLIGYNKIIACGYSLAFLQKANIKINIFIPYGSDLTVLPFMQYSRNPIFFIKYNIFSYFQRKAIVNALYIFMEPMAEVMESRLQKLSIKGERKHHGIPFIYNKDFSLNKIADYSSQSKYWEVFEEIRNNNEIIIFHHSRHYWKTPDYDKVSYKGNNKLITGFSEFKKKFNNVKACLILFEYGPDVQASKDIINELGIETDVRWMPLMSRKEILIGMSFSDIVVGALEFSWFSYGVVHEALSMSKPLIHHRKSELYKEFYEQLYPMISINTSEGVYNTLVDLYKNKHKYQEIGKGGKDWFDKYFVDEAISRLKLALQQN